MPAIDLRTILTPVVGQVATLVFPDTVAIEEPVPVQDDTGDPVLTWDSIEEGVPALIEPVNARSAAYFMGATVTTTDVTITLAGDRDIHPDYRIRAEYSPPDDPDPRQTDRWDVVGVSRDPARVTTVVLGRRTAPGTPDEGS
jgi:head-tail adaptor